ncbi:L-aspartate oxidase [Aeribacillus pallidus]|uniref:L-aspartate oxidase n=1 Tax=Aeribacillus pallidus TaxID=33936 RepID=UPI003D209D4C
MMKCDVLIVGSGIAALQLAKHLMRDYHVRIITKSLKTHSNSYLAQGGIAAPLAPDDSIILHVQDTLNAGRFTQHEDSVYSFIKEGKNAIEQLIAEGAPFDTDPKGQLLLGMEGAHQSRRIVHCGGDQTGKQIIDFLLQQVFPYVEWLENEFVYDLIVDETTHRCIGVKSISHDGTIQKMYADHVVFATGGVGGIYEFSSNDPTVVGDGLAIAYRHGVAVADVEFIQFHPTLFYKDGKAKGLISEAVRGEGARLVNDSGYYFMEGIHPLKELAPRHVVAQAIFDEMRKGRNVYLDISRVSYFEQKFPTISQFCEKQGISISSGKIPVAPGCHFIMGGIVTDSVGRTTLPHFYAIGEVAFSGVHGANRLASNSLLEGLVFGRRLASWIKSERSSLSATPNTEKNWPTAELKPSFPIKDEIRKLNMERVGIVRHQQALNEHVRWLEQFHLSYWLTHSLDQMEKEDIQTLFMLVTSYLISQGAIKRRESRGGHFRSDFPLEDERWRQKTIMQQMNDYGWGKQHECIEIEAYA